MHIKDNKLIDLLIFKIKTQLYSVLFQLILNIWPQEVRMELFIYGIFKKNKK
jgi:hypothetical protein